jgi:hypothetical protein
VCSNGALVSCPTGIMDGQLIIFMNLDEPQSILILAMSSNPDLERIQAEFKTFIVQKFPQCISLPCLPVLPFHLFKFFSL